MEIAQETKLFSVTNVEDCSRSTKLLAQTTLRNILGTTWFRVKTNKEDCLGTKTLAQMLSDREIIGLNIQETLDEATGNYLNALLQH